MACPHSNWRGTAVLEPVAHVVGGLEEGVKEVNGLLTGYSVVWVEDMPSSLVPAFDPPELDLPALLLEMVWGKAIWLHGRSSVCRPRRSEDRPAT